MKKIDKGLQRTLRKALAEAKSHKGINEGSKKIDFGQTVAGATLIKPDEDTNALIASRGLIRASAGEALTTPEREALKGYIELFTTILTTPALRSRIRMMQKMVSKGDDSNEKTRDAEEDK